MPGIQEGMKVLIFIAGLLSGGTLAILAVLLAGAGRDDDE